MEQEQVEKLLRKARSHIHVDEELKSSLRKSLLKRRKPLWKKPGMYAVVAAALLFLSFAFRSEQTNYVAAEDLLITNAVSFVDIGSGDITTTAHHKNNLYVSIRNQGIFLYTQNGLEKLTDTDADEMSMDETGTTLLFSQKGTIYQLNLKNREEKLILEGSSPVQYQQPVWKDKDEFFVTKESDKEKQIVLVSLRTLKEKLVTEGYNASVSDDGKLLVFEQNGDIWLRDLKNKEEKNVDQGKDPSFSKDGRYITYIKEENRLGDVWIIDADLETKRKVTSNIMVETQGLYEYHSPIWDAEKYQLYVMKKRTADENATVQLMKIELDKQKLTAEATVDRFLQALIVRDDDYARSLMEHPPEFLTYSNPRFVGYRVIESEEKGNAVLVKAEVYRSETVLPYYSISQYEFELTERNHGYIIDHVVELSMEEVAAFDGEHLQINHIPLNIQDMEDPNAPMMSEGTEEALFSLKDVPKQMIKNDYNRLGNLVYDQKKDQIIFSVQEMKGENNPVRDETNRNAVTLWIYDRASQSFTFLERFHSLQGNNDVGISGMTLSPDGRYLALNLSTEDFSPYVLIYDLNKKEQTALLDHTHSLFWQGEHFLIQREYENQSMLYYFNPSTGSIGEGSLASKKEE